MAKLTAAKCPSCGANIEVNKTDETTLCQYCNTAIIVEDAIQKYKVEISGKVEVEGIKGRSSKLRQAKKHIAIDEIDDAEKLLLELIKEDKFDVEAYSELLKVAICRLDEIEFDGFHSSWYSDHKSWDLYNKFDEYYTRILKIDENKQAFKNYKDYKEALDKYLAIREKIEKNKDECKKIVNKLNDYVKKLEIYSQNYNEYSIYSKVDYVKEWFYDIVCEQYNVVDYDTWFRQDEYQFIDFNTLSQDGIMLSNYANKRGSDLPNIDLYPTSWSSKCSSIEQVKERFKIIQNKTEEYFAKLDQEQIKIEKKNKSAKVTSRIKGIISVIILLIVVVFPIYLFIKHHPVYAIICIIIDCRLVPFILGMIFSYQDDLEKRANIKKN